MNRAHAYKAAVQANEEAGEDPDFAVTMGLFSYPVLMAADILMFNAQKIPVGRDQIQHVEMARDIAQRFNHNFAEVFTLPEAVVDGDDAVLQGLDGRKMSKSYNNTIPLFQSEKALQKAINKIKTNLLEPGVPKDPDDSTVFQLWLAFASPEKQRACGREFENGIAWGEAKKQLFELIKSELTDARDRYTRLMDDPGYIESVLQRGAERAREHSSRVDAKKVAHGVGIMHLCLLRIELSLSKPSGLNGFCWYHSGYFIVTLIHKSPVFVRLSIAGCVSKASFSAG